MTPLPAPIDAPLYPPGCEHLDANRLIQGYTDRGQYAEWTDNIVKSNNDTCDYRLVKLKNGIECMLVRNPTAEACSASMAVRVGHLQDPDNLPGLAHFLEHLLFMGSAKFPGENEYSDHLSKSHGWSNAYTSTHQTVYFFECAHSGFDGALDRFSQFFVSPLFNANCVEREIKAVDSEHQKNLQNDGRRLYQLGKSLAKEDHPFHKFGTGSLDTLWVKPKAAGVDIRSELIKFYEEHYSANLMKLTLVSNQPLDQTLSQALQYFNEVPNRNRLPIIFPGEPYAPSTYMTRVLVKTIADRSSVTVQMPFYDFSQTIGARAAEIVAHLLSNAGPTSLYTFLKRKGLVLGLGAYPYNAAPGIDFFEISCNLTREGLEKHQLVVASIFEYLKLLRSKPLPAWTFSELKRILEMAFKFQETTSPADKALEISTDLHNTWPRSEVLHGSYAVTDEDAEKVKYALSYLVKEKARVTVASQKPVEGLTYDQREKWYGTEYQVQSLDNQWFEAQLDDKDQLALPSPNRFIPSNLELVGTRATGKPFPRPLLLKETLGQRLWWKQDDRWKVPKANVWIKSSNPFLRSSYKNSVLCGCYVYLIADALEKYTDDAGVAGLGYWLGQSGDSLNIAISGYTDKLADLLKLVLRKMKDFKADEQRFAVMKEAKLRSLENESHASPTAQCGSELAWITSASGPTSGQRKHVLSEMTPESLNKFAKELISKFYVESLCHGNLTRTTAYELLNMAEEILGFDRVPRKSNFITRLVASSKEEVNNAIEYYIHVGHPDDHDITARLTLLEALIAEPCFNVLRTKEQLGYIVQTGVRSGASHKGLRVIIQSARNPVYLETRIIAFLESFADQLENMDLEKFESAKNGLISDLQEDYKNQDEESGWYWTQVDNGLYDFFSRDRLATMLKPLSLRDMATFYKEHIHPSSETRAKVSVHLYSQRVNTNESDRLVEALKEHGVDAEPVQEAIKKQPLPKELHETVDKHLKEKADDLHHCCKVEILNEVDKLGRFPELEKELNGAKIIDSAALKFSLKVGEPRKPVGNFYDGPAKL